jgi:hypothetical protein
MPLVPRAAHRALATAHSPSPRTRPLFRRVWIGDSEERSVIRNTTADSGPLCFAPRADRARRPENCPSIDQHAHIAMYAMLRGDFVKRLDRNRLLSQVLSSDFMSRIAECHSLPRDHAPEGGQPRGGDQERQGHIPHRGAARSRLPNVPDHREASYATLESAVLRSRGSRTAARRGDHLGCRRRGQSCIGPHVGRPRRSSRWSSGRASPVHRSADRSPSRPHGPSSESQIKNSGKAAECEGQD